MWKWVYIYTYTYHTNASSPYCTTFPHTQWTRSSHAITSTLHTAITNLTIHPHTATTISKMCNKLLANYSSLIKYGSIYLEHFCMLAVSLLISTATCEGTTDESTAWCWSSIVSIESSSFILVAMATAMTAAACRQKVMCCSLVHIKVKIDHVKLVWEI